MSQTEAMGGVDYEDGAVTQVSGEGAPPIELPPTSRGGGSFWRFINDRNPIFLLSAICMFAGYRMILGAMNTPPGDVGGLVPLIAVLNLYEVALISLGLVLIRRRGLFRDGWILLAVEALFLVDLTNLQSEVYAASVRQGLMLNGVCLVLALIKIGVVVRMLRLRLSLGEWGLIGAGLAMLFGMQGAFKALATKEGELDARVLYGAWWAAGALAAVAGFVGRGDRTGRFMALPRRLYILIPFASLIVHLCGANRVYETHFHPANIAPVLLGIAAALSGVRWLPWTFAAKMQMVLIAGAGLMSLQTPRDLTWVTSGIWFSPLRVTLMAAMMIALWSAIRYRQWAFVFAAGGCAVVAVLGHTAGQARQTFIAMLERIGEFTRAMIPTTPMGWGIIAVVTSFILLGLGAVVSLRKGVEGDGDLRG